MAYVKVREAINALVSIYIKSAKWVTSKPGKLKRTTKD